MGRTRPREHCPEHRGSRGGHAHTGRLINYGSKHLMGPYSDYTLMERNRLLQEHVHTLEGMLRASCSEVGRGGEWAGAARDFSEACEQAGDLLERNRLLQGRVHTLEGLLRAYRIIQAYRREVVSGEDRSELARKRYEAYEEAC